MTAHTEIKTADTATPGQPLVAQRSSPFRHRPRPRPGPGRPPRPHSRIREPPAARSTLPWTREPLDALMLHVRTATVQAA